MPSRSSSTRSSQSNSPKRTVRTLTFHVRRSFSSLRDKFTDLAHFGDARIRPGDAESTWLPLDLRARYNEEVYGYIEAYTFNTRFGMHRDSVECLAPHAVRNAILDRYYEEEREKYWLERGSLSLGTGCGGQVAN
ncbi:hypothetical protein SCUP234_09236 [Seiridium cupressi]